MKVPFARHLLLLMTALSSFSSAASAAESASKTGGDFLKYDRGDVVLQFDQKDTGKGSIPASGWAEFDVETASAGWYGLYFRDLPNLAREVFLDGQRVDLSFGESPKSAADLLGIPLQKMTADGWTKVANLPLKSGKHTIRFLRVGRMGFPSGLPRAWELRPADAAADRIQARVVGHRELRKGEDLKLSITGGAGPASSFTLYRLNELTSDSEEVAIVNFPESKDFVTKEVKIPAQTEGVFQIHAKTADHLLTSPEFLEGSYFVVDTKSRPQNPNGDASMKLLYDVDCVTNTINGSPVEAGKNYWEANGATRISETAAGKYRESGDGRGPEVNSHAKHFAENFSGFAYLLDVPQTGNPYVIEIDHPDDDWRSVCVAISDVFDKENKKGYLPPTYAFETGGNLPLSNTSQTEKIMFWPNGKQLHLALASARIGKRAAASRIRIYEVEGDLPSQAAGDKGRFVGLYMEEIKRWHTHFNTPKQLPLAVRDFIGLQRTIQWAAYVGMNAFWPTVAAYQESTYDSRELVGFLLQYYNVPRLSALLCEKYGLGYVGEILMAKQRYFNEKVMLEGVDNPKDLYTASWWGYRACDSDSSGGIMPSWNVLHPRVQEKMIAIYGELADAVGDTSSFVGLSGRLESWQWDGLYSFSSLNWGYEDWTINEFEKDTGIKVPGAKDDPKRYEERFRFLTSPENKARWVQWRKDRVTDYLKRLSARIRKANKNATLFLVGDARTDESHKPSIPPLMQDRLAEMGVDVAAFTETSGVTVMPTAGYGRGKSLTYLADQDAYDEFLNTSHIHAGGGSLRGFAQFGLYQEWGDEFPLDKLGLPLERWWYCSSSDAAGRNSLERLSSVLAEQDTMAIRDGGYPQLPGRRDFYSEWIGDFSRLPRKPFEAVPFARDPVAVWQRAEKDGFLFYAVNREQYDVSLELTVKGASEITRLVTGKSAPVKEGRIVLTLKPYELQAYKAPAGTKIVSASTAVPEDRIEFLKKRLTYAQGLLDEMATGIFKDSFSQSQKDDYRKTLDESWKAFQAKSYWLTRTLLSSAPMMAVYEKFGAYPEGQVKARFTNALENVDADRFEPNEPFLNAETLMKTIAASSGAKLVPSEQFDPEWKFIKVVQSGAQGLPLELEVPVPGYYQLSVGFVGSEPGLITGALAGQSLPIPLPVRKSGMPERITFPKVQLPAGKTSLELTAPMPFGIYAVKLVPVLQQLPTTLWSTVGPFRSSWRTGLRGDDEAAALKIGADKIYPPQQDLSLNATYKNESGRDLKWSQTKDIVGSHEETGVNFSQRIGVTGMDISFAVTFIHSPQDQDALFYIGTDWWANAYLNGEFLKPAGDLADQEKSGYWFHRWKPRPVKIRLKKGENTLLVKNQGGSMHCWFTAYISDPGNLSFSPLPNAAP